MAWEVLLETADSYLDRYTLRMLTAMPAAEAANWRQCIQAAWELLVRHHEWAAGPIAAGVPVIVPLVPRSDLDSATSPAAFGAIATSLPPSPVIMAETLVHEFQHIKLCGLMDMLSLIEPSDDQGVRPVARGPAPAGRDLAGGLRVHGDRALLGRPAARGDGARGILRRSVLYERWRLAIEFAVGSCSDRGRYSARRSLRHRAQGAGPVPESGPVPAEAGRSRWRWPSTTGSPGSSGTPRSTAPGSPGWRPRTSAASRSAAGSFPGWIEDDIRKVDSVRQKPPAQHAFPGAKAIRAVVRDGRAELGAADALLLRGDADAAVAAYRGHSPPSRTRPPGSGWRWRSTASRASPPRPVFATQLAAPVRNARLPGQQRYPR